MTVEEAIIIVDTVLNKKHLSYIQELVFPGVGQGRTYEEIAERSGYDTDYIKHVGSELWQVLSRAFGEKVSKSSLRSVLRRRSQQTQVSAAPPESTDINTSAHYPQNNELKATANQRQDWGEAIDVSIFYVRAQEIATLEPWIVQERCRLVALLGMGGIGKTALCVKLTKQIKDKFEYLIWRSLRNAPPVQDLQSCLVLTSREKPIGLAAKEGETLAVRSLQLTGLPTAAGREIFKARGDFWASESEWRVLIADYAGNPLAFKDGGSSNSSLL